MSPVNFKAILDLSNLYMVKFSCKMSMRGRDNTEGYFLKRFIGSLCQESIFFHFCSWKTPSTSGNCTARHLVTQKISSQLESRSQQVITNLLIHLLPCPSLSRHSVTFPFEQSRVEFDLYGLKSADRQVEQPEVCKYKA